MRSRRLYVVNESTLLELGDVKKMVSAVNKQIRDHAARAWGVNRVVVEYHAGSLENVQNEVPKDSWVFALMDDPDQAGALGWHWVDDKDRIYSENFVKPCLDAGSTALTGPYAVSSVLSHEAIETLVDPFCVSWSDTNKGFLVATEACDPVESDGYEIDGVQVSNFVLPQWFDPIQIGGEQYDYMNKCTAPFSMTKGGYWVQMSAGSQSQQFKRTVDWEQEVGFDVRGTATHQAVFSPEMPQWKRDLKMMRGRNLIKRGGR